MHLRQTWHANARRDGQVCGELEAIASDLAKSAAVIRRASERAARLLKRLYDAGLVARCRTIHY